jgi:hypothetical protein
MCSIGSCEQQKKGGPPAWGLGDVLIIPERRNLNSYVTIRKASTLE